MKLSAIRTSSGFFETFSDLIFATMAIFALIMIVMMVMVQLKSAESDVLVSAAEAKIKEREKDVEEIRKQLDTVVEELQQAKDDHSALREKYAESVETQKIELVLLIDGSSSMGEPMKGMREAVVKISETVPLVASEFSIGIIVYRRDLSILPLTRVKLKREDNGVSLQKLSAFASTMYTDGAPVVFVSAVEAGLSMFSERSGRKSLLIVGDVGPYEEEGSGTDQRCFDRRARDNDRTVHNLVQNFAENNSDFNLFLVRPPLTSVECKPQTRELFSRLASLQDLNGNYTEETSKILTLLLYAVLGEKYE
ncbi:MAG: hypothetical protein PsegKO_34670 [Pseudohongiellaceae bacterium]